MQAPQKTFPARLKWAIFWPPWGRGRNRWIAHALGYTTIWGIPCVSHHGQFPWQFSPSTHVSKGFCLHTVWLWLKVATGSLGFSQSLCCCLKILLSFFNFKRKIWFLNAHGGRGFSGQVAPAEPLVSLGRVVQTCIPISLAGLQLQEGVLNKAVISKMFLPLNKKCTNSNY